MAYTPVQVGQTATPEQLQSMGWAANTPKSSDPSPQAPSNPQATPTSVSSVGGNTYSYVDKGGQVQTITATNPQEALSKTQNISPGSGVQLNQSTPQTPPATTPTPPTPTTPSTTLTTQPTLADQADRDALAKAQKEQQDAAKTFADTITNIQNGAIPLSAGEQAQVSGLQQQYQDFINQQKLTNTAASGVANIRGYQTGAAEYDPTFQAKTIGSIITAGNNKILDLNTKMASAVATLTQSLKDNDIAKIKESYDALNAASDKRQAALQKTIDDTQKAIKDAQDAQQKITDGINAIAVEAAKNGADAKTMAAISSAGSVSGAISAAGDSLQTATGTLGDYLGYKRQALSVGHQPLSYDDWRNAEDQRALNLKSKEAYASAYASESAKSRFVGSNKNQQALEKDYKNTLLKELSNRSGGLGLQDQKVNQAIHLKSLFDQYYDPKTGAYNIPKVQYSEIAMGLANLISGSGTVSDSARESILQKTAKGDFNGALSYITGNPQNGTTQEVFKNLKDSIDRQGAVAEDLRNQAIGFLHGLAPTDLDPSRVQSLEQNTLASYTNPTKDPNIQAENDAEKSISNYKLVHPENSAAILKNINIMKTTLGREPTAVELLQAFPEYQ